VFVGSLNPSTGDIGMIVPLEHTVLARGAADEERTRVFARYSLIGTGATAAGALAAAAPDFLVSFGVARIEALKLMFYVYGLLGVVGVLLYWRLPHEPPQRAEARVAGLGPSRRTVYKLAALFSLDAFAGGFVVPSILALWLFERFDLSLAVASVFFFWTNVLGALSFPVAARLARRFGLINTMVFTHIPSSLCLVLAAFSSSMPVVLGLLLVRAALAQMDVPTRTSYVMAVVTPAERPAAASVTAVPRSLASALSPALSGALLAGSFAGLPLVACGVLKILYDVALLLSFRTVKPPEERGP
jgi:predicted MFS family arabinose efflux permease